MRIEKRFGRAVLLALLMVGLCQAVSAQPAKRPLKIYILAGQSNMEGHAKISSFDHMAMDPATAPILKEMRDDDGNPKVCEDVWISYLCGMDETGEGVGRLTTGFGSRRDPQKDGGKIGPEFTFGIFMQKHVDQPILIIKTAWGGKSLHTDFRPPSAGPYVLNENQVDQIRKQGKDLDQARAERTKASGRYYRLMIEHVQRVLADPKRVYPDYDSEQGYELSGFVWFQGWNDMVDRGVYPHRSEQGGYDQYSELLAKFIRSVRTDLSAPEMHFVIGVFGVGGPTSGYPENAQRYKSTHDNFRKAMSAPAMMPEFKENVTAVFTESYWDAELDRVLEKRSRVNQMAKSLRNKNKGYPDQAGSVSPQAQKKIVDDFRASLLTDRDHKLLKGVTNAQYHYLGSAKIMAQIGKGFADALDAASKK